MRRTAAHRPAVMCCCLPLSSSTHTHTHTHTLSRVPPSRASSRPVQFTSAIAPVLLSGGLLWPKQAACHQADVFSRHVSDQWRDHQGLGELARGLRLPGSAISSLTAQSSLAQTSLRCTHKLGISSRSHPRGTGDLLPQLLSQLSVTPAAGLNALTELHNAPASPDQPKLRGMALAAHAIATAAPDQTLPAGMMQPAWSSLPDELWFHVLTEASRAVALRAAAAWPDPARLVWSGCPAAHAQRCCRLSRQLSAPEDPGLAALHVQAAQAAGYEPRG